MIISPGTYEYCAIQRKGKTTLMVGDLVKLLDPAGPWRYRPDHVYANFPIFLDGVNCMNNAQMLETIDKAKRDRWRECVFLLDECSQPPLFYARNTSDKLQTSRVTFIWQVPKRGHCWLVSDNVGLSMDIQMRDGTWFTIMPMKYYEGETRSMDYIEYRVIAGYEMWYQDWILHRPDLIQSLFDSYHEVE